ncbi:MAG: ATP-dependent DNA helicase RecG [Candidatus Gastranaerophilales bacterium]|nr:ATP-dependent DNA helicase RecG [Candidatus Gastranaerophilales bacterium]
MKLIDKLENKEVLKKALELEVSNHYIDLTGKTKTFSKFMLTQIKKIIKLMPKNEKWRNVYNSFSCYHLFTLSERIKLINDVCELLTEEFIEVIPVEKKPFTNDPNTTDVTYCKGVGPKISVLLNKLKIFTVMDLLTYYPSKHLDYSNRTKIKDLKEGENVTIFGEIRDVNMHNSPNKPVTILTLVVTDGTGRVKTTRFFKKLNRKMLEHYKSQYPKGANVILSGQVKHDDFYGGFTIDKQEITVITADFEQKDSIHNGRIVPIYPLCENMNVKILRKAIFNAIELYLDKVENILPANILEQYNLLDKQTAIKQIHFPDNFEILEQAKRSLIFEELFILQLKFMLIREQVRKTITTQKINIKPNGLVDKFVKSLPFKLTEGQNKAFNEILSDLNSTEPMQRLLQGDVGSGKTVVACMMLLAAVENGYQGAIMAPTEILATQHYKNFTEWLTPLGLHVGLFVGKHGVKVRREMQTNLANGQTHIAVGTHALIQEGVEFKNLGAVVVDEQHRFGVNQRKDLAQKGVNPQLLTMTATPIPRTLALSVHGDLDVTSIDELPKGRKPVITTHISGMARRKEAYDLIRSEVKKGNRAYIVFPLIDESETLSAKAATKEAEKLKEKVFPDLRIGLVHGKLPAQEKEENMQKFKNGEYDILVSTTVIEVGVDVPEATVMIIENAERFGLSQLHQLRGRVGRSDRQSYCILASDSKSPETKARLEVMTQTNNGFVIAEKDLQLRGPGEFMGTRQSGLPDLMIADIVNDVEILEMARNAALNFVKEDKIENYPPLEHLIKEKLAEMQSYVAAG